MRRHLDGDNFATTMTNLARSTTLALSVAMIAAAGCASGSARPGVPDVGRRPPPGVGGSSPVIRDSSAHDARSVMERKRVAGKREVSTLVADDASTCTVTEKRYRETNVGDHVWCVWSGGIE